MEYLNYSHTILQVYGEKLDPNNLMPVTAQQLPHHLQDRPLSTDRVVSGIAKGGMRATHTAAYTTRRVTHLKSAATHAATLCTHTATQTRGRVTHLKSAATHTAILCFLHRSRRVRYCQRRNKSDAPYSTDNKS